MTVKYDHCLLLPFQTMQNACLNANNSANVMQLDCHEMSFRRQMKFERMENVQQHLLLS